MRKLVTVHVRGFANFIGSHFQNLQDELLVLAGDPDNDPVLKIRITTSIWTLSTALAKHIKLRQSRVTVTSLICSRFVPQPILPKLTTGRSTFFPFDPRGASRPSLSSARKPSLLSPKPTKTSVKTPPHSLTMYRLHRLTLAAKTFHRHQNHRFFSQASASIIEEPPSVETIPLDGFPKPDHLETIFAIPRLDSGKNVSAKERKAGRVPSIVFEQEDGQHGGNKRLISVQKNRIRNLVNKLGRSFFLSRLFELDVRPQFESCEVIEKVRVLPRLVHLHAGTDEPLNVTFIRAPSHALLKVDIPLVFRGEDISPGLRKGAYLNTIKRTVKFLCPADIVPPYIDVDLSELDVGQKLLMEDLKVHPALKLVQSKDLPVVKIMGGRVSDKKSK